VRPWSWEPAEGTTAGGTVVTLTGAGLAANASVVIDGVACAVDAGLTNASTIVCTAGRRAAHVTPSTLSVVVPSLGGVGAAVVVGRCRLTPSTQR
jgi:hypothetical protein